MAAGFTAQQMTEGVQRYAAFCKATHKLQTAYVMQGSTFFGPGEHFMEPYDLPGSRGDRVDLGDGRYRQDGRIYGADGKAEVVW